jgi:hypothetical protein
MFEACGITGPGTTGAAFAPVIEAAKPRAPINVKIAMRM